MNEHLFKELILQFSNTSSFTSKNTDKEQRYSVEVLNLVEMSTYSLCNDIVIQKFLSACDRQYLITIENTPVSFLYISKG